MRTLWGVFVTISLILSATLFVGSGFLGTINADTGRQLSNAQERVEDAANDSAIHTGLEASRKAQSDQNFLAFILSGAGAALNLAKLILIWPLAIQALGGPAWFAYPVGTVLEVLTGVGIFQVGAGRYWR